MAKADTNGNALSTTTKLTDIQFAMMKAATQREDRFLAPTELLKGAKRRKAGDKLIDSALVREVRAKPGIPVWRGDDETGVFDVLRWRQNSSTRRSSRPRGLRERHARSRGADSANC